MHFQHDWPKDKKLQLLLFLPENLEKYRSTEHYGAPLEGSRIFICRSYLGCTSILILILILFLMMAYKPVQNT